MNIDDVLAENARMMRKAIRTMVGVDILDLLYHPTQGDMIAAVDVDTFEILPGEVDTVDNHSRNYWHWCNHTGEPDCSCSMCSADANIRDGYEPWVPSSGKHCIADGCYEYIRFTDDWCANCHPVTGNPSDPLLPELLAWNDPYCPARTKPIMTQKVCS